jgi:hypothetical protein
MTVDLETTVDGAWRHFRRALAETMDALEAGESLQIALDPGEDLEGAPPSVHARRVGGWVVLEVPSNQVLAAAFRLSRSGLGKLRGLGLRRRDGHDSSYHAAFPTSHVDQAAWVATATLRDTFGVIHPSFLVSADCTWLAGSRPARAVESPAPELPVSPTNRAELDRLVDRALTSVIGHPPVRDSDGDVPFVSDSAVVFVRTDDLAPIVQVFAEMVVEIRDLEAAAREVAILNADISGVKFTLYGDRVVASMDLLARPFVAEHLRSVVDNMCQVVPGNDALLAARVSGRVFLSAEAGGCDAEAPEGP